MTDTTKMFLDAVEYGHFDQVKAMVARGFDVNAKDQHGITGFLIAVMRLNNEMIDFLIESGADVHATDKQGFNALLHLVDKGRAFRKSKVIYKTNIHKLVELAQKLLALNLDINHTTPEYKNSALRNAAYYGLTELVELFLAVEGIDLEVVDRDGATPLFSACTSQVFKCVEPLVEAGANVNAYDHLGQTPMIDAINNLDYKTVKYLIEKSASPFAIAFKENAFMQIGWTPLDRAQAMLQRHRSDKEVKTLKRMIKLLEKTTKKQLPHDQLKWENEIDGVHYYVELLSTGVAIGEYTEDRGRDHQTQQTREEFLKGTQFEFLLQKLDHQALSEIVTRLRSHKG